MELDHIAYIDVVQILLYLNVHFMELWFKKRYSCCYTVFDLNKRF